MNATLSTTLTLLAALLLVVLGVAGVVHGEGDDSPGLQGLGLLLVVGAVALLVRSRRARTR